MTQTTQNPAFFVTGGTVPLSAASYLERAADQELLSALLAGEYCFVLNARQMGKSSLSVRTMQKLSEQGIQTVFVDLQKFGGANVTPEQWYISLLAEIGRMLSLRREVLLSWKEQEAYTLVRRFFGALREVVLEQIPGPVVILIDEIDSVRSLPFATDEFFGALRECYNERVQDPVVGRMTFCLVGSVLPADLIQDRRTSPFNIGKRIELKDFTREEVQPLAEGLGENAQTLIQRVYFWTNGHPYLTQSLCAELASQPEVKTPTDVDQVVSSLFFEAKAKERHVNLADVAHRVLSHPGERQSAEEFRAQVLDLYGQMLAGKPVVDDEADRRAAVLKLSGITQTVEGCLRVRNRIYTRVFDKRWIQEQMPDAEVRRQKAAYRRGLIRASAIAVMILAVVGSLAVTALRMAFRAEVASRQAALNASRREIAFRKVEALRQQAQHDLYIADMNRVQSAYEANNMGQMLELLGRHRDDPHRGWEWDYWYRLCHQEHVTLRGHIGDILAVAYSPDGRYLVTGSADKTVKVWEARTGRLLRTLQGHREGVTSVAVSPDGRTIATGGGDSVKLWEARTGRVLRTLPESIWWLNSVVFSPDGRLLLTGSGSGAAKLWEARTGRLLRTFPGHQIISMAYAADGKTILTGSRDKTARVWDARTGQALGTLTGNQSAIWGLAISPDGQRIVTGSEDAHAEARVWEARTGKVLHILSGHTGAVNAIAFTRDGRWMVTGSNDTTARVWDAQTGQEKLTLKGHSAHVETVAFSPDGRYIATGSRDMTVKVWDTRSAQDALHLAGHREFVKSVAFSPDGQYILTGSFDNTAKIWEARTGRGLLTLTGHTGRILSVACSKDGQRIATGSADGTAKVWAAQRGNVLLTLKGHTSGVVAAFSPDGNRIVTGSNDTTARVWDARTGRERLTLTGHTDGITSVAFAPDGKTIGTGSQDQIARVWDAQTGTAMVLLRGHTHPVLAIAFSPDGQRLVTGSEDTTVKVWDVPTGQERLTLTGHTGTVWSAAFSPDGKRIVSGSFDKTVKVWDAQTGRLLLNLTGFAGDGPTAVFSPDGRRLLTSWGDKTARVSAAASARQIALWRQGEDRSAHLREVARTRALTELARAAQEAEQRQRLIRASQSDPGAIKQWLLLGPIPVEPHQRGAHALDQQQLPREAHLKPRKGQNIAIQGRSFTWQPLHLPQYMLDLGVAFGSPTEYQAAYAVSYIVSDRKQTDLQIRMGSDDDAKLYLNGKALLRRGYSGACIPDDVTVEPVTLQQGVNALVFKIVNGYGPWGGCLRFTDKVGQPVQGLRVQLHP